MQLLAIRVFDAELLCNEKTTTAAESASLYFSALVESCGRNVG